MMNNNNKQNDSQSIVYPYLFHDGLLFSCTLFSLTQYRYSLLIKSIRFIFRNMTTTIPNRLSNGHQITISNDDKNEEDQLNRINLQALQNRDPYISKIVDQAQRVCVYKFIAEKREWVKKEKLKSISLFSIYLFLGTKRS